MRGHLITHDQCLDGATAAMVGLACDLEPTFVAPDRVESAVAGLLDQGTSASIYLADVSLTEASYQRWQPHIGWILDHHVSASALARYDHVTLDLGRSGSHLMYDFAVDRGWLEPSPAWDRLVEMVESYDLWKPRHDFGQGLEQLFRSLGFDWYCRRFGLGWTPYSDEEGRLRAELVRAEAGYVARQLERVQHRDVGPLGIAGICLDQEGSVNDFSHGLLDSGYALVVVAKSDGRLSARSDHRIDVSLLMGHLFAGGGHRRAAGGRLPADVANTDQGMAQVLDRITEYLQAVPASPA